MFDDTPLELEELIDQCRALAYAVMNLDNPMMKEILTYKLCEQVESVHTKYLADLNQIDDPAECCDDKISAEFS